VELRPSKPNFQSVMDLGLRDVGVKSDPRRLARHFGKGFVPVFVLVVVSVVALCAVVSLTGVGAWIAVPFVLVWGVAGFALTLRMVKRSPPVVVRVTAEGTNQATWLVVAPFLLLALSALLAWNPLLLPLVVLMIIMSLLLWRGRGHLPEVLRKLRALLAADESVLGDGIGAAQGHATPGTRSDWSPPPTGVCWWPLRPVQRNRSCCSTFPIDV
jgi:hypothetical protein